MKPPRLFSRILWVSTKSHVTFTDAINLAKWQNFLATSEKHDMVKLRQQVLMEKTYSNYPHNFISKA